MAMCGEGGVGGGGGQYLAFSNHQVVKCQVLKILQVNSVYGSSHLEISLKTFLLGSVSSRQLSCLNLITETAGNSVLCLFIL